jgi:hypothetical protein
MLDFLMAAVITMSHPQAPADTTTTVTIEEDSVGPNGESLWDCTRMGDLRCGPGNAQGVPPGDYSKR